MKDEMEDYRKALQRAKKDRADLEGKRKQLERINERIGALDSMILQISAYLSSQSAPLEEKGKTQKPEEIKTKPSKPLADLIHEVMNERGISSFRIPLMKAEFVKRGWIEDKPSAGLVLRNAALRRKKEFTVKNAELFRIGKPSNSANTGSSNLPEGKDK